MGEHVVRMPALGRGGGERPAQRRPKAPSLASLSKGGVSVALDCAFYALAALGLVALWGFFFAAAYGFSNLCPKAPLFDASPGQVKAPQTRLCQLDTTLFIGSSLSSRRDP